MAKKKSVAILTGLGYSFVKGGLISKVAIALYRFSLKFSKEIWVLNSDDKETLIENKIGNREKVFILQEREQIVKDSNHCLWKEKMRELYFSW